MNPLRSFQILHIRFQVPHIDWSQDRGFLDAANVLEETASPRCDQHAWDFMGVDVRRMCEVSAVCRGVES